MSEMARKSIDGYEYEIVRFGAKQSLRVMIRLSKVLGKPMALAMSSLAGGKEQGKSLLDVEIKGEMLVQAVDALMERMDEDTILNLIEELAGESTVMCDGKKVIFNKHYEGRLDHLFRVVAAVLEVQYGNFMAALFAFQSSLKPKAGSTQAPTT